MIVAAADPDRASDALVLMIVALICVMALVALRFYRSGDE